MKRSWPGRALLALSLLALPAVAQQGQQGLPAPTTHELPGPPSDPPLRYVVQLPAGDAPDRRSPLVVLLPDGAGDLAAATAVVASVGRELASEGFVVVSPALDRGEEQLAALFARLRQTHRIDQGGMHAAGGGAGARSAARVVLRHAHEFQTITLWGGATEEEAAPLRGLHERRVHVLGTPGAAELRRHFTTMHAARAERGLAGDVALTLDDFHDAAAKGDERRYFAILPDDAVFLGTDATERWSGAEFRRFAMPYFERGPAWTYVPLRRHVTVAASGALAWFDEVLDNEAYGECRGSGVLELRQGRWVVRQYNLTVPVPNDLMRGIAERIRSFAAGRAPAVTTVVVVRHAEKNVKGDDPDLTDAGVIRSLRLAETLEGLRFAAVYTSEFRRTAATVVPLCQRQRIQARIVPAGDPAGLAARIQKEHRGQAVLVAGHSNTVPQILKALGVKDEVVVGEEDYDRLFVVTISLDGVSLLSLRYGGS